MKKEGGGKQKEEGMTIEAGKRVAKGRTSVKPTRGDRDRLPGLPENLSVSSRGAVALWDNRIAGSVGVPRTLAGI